MADTIKVGKRLRRWLDDQNYRYSFDPEDGECRGSWNVDCSLKSVQLIFRPYSNAFMVLGVCKRNADPENYGRIVEYLTRANYGLSNGCFEFDHRDGEIRYRAYHIMNNDNDDPGSITDDVIKRMYLITLNMFERYGNGITALLDGNSSPAEEIQKAESSN